MRRKRGWMNLKIIEIVSDTWDTKTFKFLDEDDNTVAFDYYAGQYLTFRYDNITDKPVVRSYTMSSAPSLDDHIGVTVKRVSGGLVSNWMCDELKVGDVLRARGPIGKFCYDAEKCHDTVNILAAGSGVTPFLSMLREYAPKLGSEHNPKQMNMLVAYRSKGDLIGIEHINQLNKHPHINIQITLSREIDESGSYWYGRPDQAMIERFFLNTEQSKKASYFTCGPQAMMDLLSDCLIKKGVESSDIHTESFD